jgi:hypothetical protein
MQNLGNVYIWESPFVMSRTDAQNGLEIIFKSQALVLNSPLSNYYIDWSDYLSFN